MDKQKAFEQLTSEVQQLRDRAVFSTDAHIVAKAIAASDERVQAVLLKRLADGNEIVGTRILADQEPQKTRVFFDIRPRESHVTLCPQGVLAIVDISGASVSDVMDKYDAEDKPIAFTMPFALAVPSYGSGPQDFGKSEATEGREATFFQDMNIEPLAMMTRPPPVKYPVPGPEGGGFGGGGGTTTYVQTIIGCVSWSWGKMDDTRSDRFPEAADSGYA